MAEFDSGNKTNHVTMDHEVGDGPGKSPSGEKRSSGKFVMRAAQPSHVNMSLMHLPKLGLRDAHEGNDVTNHDDEIKKNDFVKEGLALKERWKHPESEVLELDEVGEADIGVTALDLREGQPEDVNHTPVRHVDFPLEDIEFDEDIDDLEVVPILKNLDRRRESDKSVSFSISGDEIIPRLADFDEEDEVSSSQDIIEAPEDFSGGDQDKYSNDTQERLSDSSHDDGVPHKDTDKNETTGDECDAKDVGKEEKTELDKEVPKAESEEHAKSLGSSQSQ